MPFGFHGVFAALTGGVVFGLQGFEQAVQLAGEARDPEEGSLARDPDRHGDRRRALRAAAARHDRRARPREHRHGLVQAARHRPVRLRRVVHAGARGGRELAGQGADRRRRHFPGGHRHRLPRRHARGSPTPSAKSARCRARWPRTNKKGVPVVSILVGGVVGSLAFGPFKSWNALVSVVTGATAIMYAFAPVSLAALHKVDGRPAALLPRAAAEHHPARRVLLREPDHLLGRIRVHLEARLRHAGRPGDFRRWAPWRAGTGARSASCATPSGSAPWLAGQVIIGWPAATARQPEHPARLDRHRRGHRLLAGDLLLGRVHSLSTEQALVEVAKDAHQLAFEPAQG